jgi:hypothetical protein
MPLAAEYAVFVLALVSASVCIMDEEPVLDLTDLSAAHVLVFSTALLVVSADNLVKMSRGQYANSDRQVYAYVSFKSSTLILYFVAIVGFFFLHTTPPVLVDGVEAANMWSTFNSLAGTLLLRPLAILFVLQGLLNLTLQSRAYVLIHATFGAYLVTLLLAFWVQLWDFLGKASTSAQQGVANELSSLSAVSSSSATYSDLGGGLTGTLRQLGRLHFFFLTCPQFVLRCLC